MPTTEKRRACGGLSKAARERILSLPLEPLFLADWQRVLMIHYEVDRAELEKVVPFPLDLWEGRAFVSLVAFTLQRMRPRIGDKLAEWLLRPISNHEFLNVRAYVRHENESGIFFLAEWLSNRLSVALGPLFFGLPYRFGKIRYEHHPLEGQLRGRVEDGAAGGRLEYVEERDIDHKGRPCRDPFEPCVVGSFNEWLMERYTAFTIMRGRRRFFRVWHEPWPQIPVALDVKHQTLLETHWPFFRTARAIGANYSPGVRDVWMGWPHALP